MANTLTGVFPTLVAAANSVQDVLPRKYALLEAATVHLSPAEGNKYDTLNVPIPNPPSSAGNRAGGDFQFANISTSNASITLDQEIQDGYIVKSFEQARTPVDIHELFLKGLTISCLDELEESAIAELNPTNYNVVNGGVAYNNTGGTADLLSTTQFLKARAGLVAKNVNMEDPTAASLLLPTLPFHNMLGDDNWTKATSVGGALAEAIRTGGQLPSAFGATIRMGQSFDTLTTGSGSGTVYKAFLMHKNAFAFAGAWEPKPDTPAAIVVDYKVYNLPFRLTISYDHKANGHYVSVHCLVGFGVLRKDSGCCIDIKTNVA